MILIWRDSSGRHLSPENGDVVHQVFYDIFHCPIMLNINVSSDLYL